MDELMTGAQKANKSNVYGCLIMSPKLTFKVFTSSSILPADSTAARGHSYRFSCITLGANVPYIDVSI
jgi:hypothetical protein